MRSYPPLLLPLLALLLLGRSAVPPPPAAVAASDPPPEDVVAFELYDNGSSDGAVNVTMDRSEFRSSSSSAEVDDDPPGLAFALDMSRLQNATKYGAEVGTVVATRAYREDGELITSFEQLFPVEEEEEEEEDGEGASGEVGGGGGGVGRPRRVYLVADGLEFVWPFVHLGHVQTVSSNVVPPVDGLGPLQLESVSDRPRVFRVRNFCTADEASQLIERALSATGDNRLKRSTVGSGKDADGKDTAHEEVGRTSENAWEYGSPVAKATISRSFLLTNVEEDPGKRDGLQIVRYMPGQGYNTHPDYFTPKDDVDFNFNPYSGGSNRFATVFMYLNDPEEGGFTVFPKAPGIVPPRDPPPGALDMFDKNTWQYRLTGECYARLALPAESGTAALFYSVTPDGRIDPSSHHGACPVTRGVKWGANIWLWNRQRYGEIRTGDGRHLVIENDADETAYVSWEGRDQSAVMPGGNVVMNTFEFHRFKAHLGSYGGETVSEYTVQSQPERQTWVIKRPRVHTMVGGGGGQTCDPSDETCSVNAAAGGGY